MPDLMCYQDVRPSIRNGDLLLYRRWGPIAIAGRGDHSHAAKAAWWGDALFVQEMHWTGGRATLLSRQVERHPKRWDVYQANPDCRWPEYDRQGATQFMKRLCGCDYGFAGLAATAMRHLPLVRWFVAPDLDDHAIDRRPPICSMACVMADRIGGGVDPVKHLADRLTEPADLARSPFYEYVGTLVP